MALPRFSAFHIASEHSEWRLLASSSDISFRRAPLRPSQRLNLSLDHHKSNRPSAKTSAPLTYPVRRLSTARHAPLWPSQRRNVPSLDHESSRPSAKASAPLTQSA